MYKLIDKAVPRETVSIRIDGQVLSVPQGITVAAALLLLDKTVFRETPAKASPRGPFCMMGSCFDCLVEINDMPNQQACMVIVEEGMHIRKQPGLAKILSDNNDLAAEVRSAIDA